jgi:hypothetical protein
MPVTHRQYRIGRIDTLGLGRHIHDKYTNQDKYACHHKVDNRFETHSVKNTSFYMRSNHVPHKKNPLPYAPGSIIEYEDDTVENRTGVDELTNLKQLVTQVVLLKTGIFAVPIMFVEKQLKRRTIFAP